MALRLDHRKLRLTGGVGRRRRRGGAAPKPGVAGTVDEGNDFLKLGHGQIGQVSAVDEIVRRRVVAVREDADQVLHGLQPLRCSLLYRHVIVHLREAQQFDRHATERRGEERREVRERERERERG